jgi:hypothetical protein
MMSEKKCIIFEGCCQLFPEIGTSISEIGKQYCDNEFALKCDGENDLKLVIVSESKNGHIKVRMFNEFNLEGIIRRHPNFLINLDFSQKRAEVLSFESNLFPVSRLDVYTEVSGETYKNIVASKDLNTLLLTWIKEIKQLNYRPQWIKKLTE